MAAVEQTVEAMVGGLVVVQTEFVFDTRLRWHQLRAVVQVEVQTVV